MNDLTTTSADELRLLLHEWNDTATPFDSSLQIQQLFEEQARQAPDAIALVCAGESTTYQELDRRSNQLAHHLNTLKTRFKKQR